MGGVGSIYNHDEAKGGAPKHLRCWNWSERIGGHVIVDPILVMNGYVERKQLPIPKVGFRWVQTYWGSTLSEFVLIRDRKHPGLEIISLEGKCPPCRHKEELETTPADLMVTHEQFAAVGAENQFEYIVRMLELPEGTSSIPACRLLEYIHDQGHHMEEVCRPAIEVALWKYKQSPTVA
ncbi:MAG TPA: hypothetical protein VK675_00520 [Candidatus Paceibacterota bacterium]|nr:hypothetical protein [Candidatus Paceibacterota bacterium]